MAADTKKLGEDGAAIPKKPGRRLRYGCMIALCLLLLPVAINLMLSFLAREEFHRELEKARKAGMPRTVSEVSPPPIPEDENAAKIYALVFPQIVQPTAQEDPAMQVFRGMKADRAAEQSNLETLRRVVQNNRAPLDRLHEAVRRPGSRFDLRYQDGLSMVLGHLSGLRHAADAMRFEARLLLAEGKTREALLVIRDLYALSDATKSEPLLISLLVRIAAQEKAASTLRRALQEPCADAEALAAIAEELEKGRDDDHLLRALRGELFLGVDTMDRVRRGGWSAVAGTLGRTPGDWLYSMFGWVLYKDMTYYLRTMSKYAELAEQPSWQARAEEARLDAQRTPRWYILSWSMLTSFAQTRNSWTRHVARRDGARLAVALARYRLARGAWPGTLDPLVPEFLPELPLDPFTGNRYAYKFEGESARVYSLGPLGYDGGGGTTAQDDEGPILWPLGDQEPFQGK